MFSKLFGNKKQRQQKKRSSNRRKSGVESLESRQLLTCTTLMPVEVAEGETVEVSRFSRFFRHHRCESTVDRTIDSLTAGIESGELPGDITAEQAQGIVDGLNAAVVAGDSDAAAELVGQVDVARQVDKLRSRVAGVQSALDAAAEVESETLYGLPVVDVASGLATANQAIVDGDLVAADAAVDVIDAARKAEAKAARQLARYTKKVERLNTALAESAEAGELTYGGVDLAEAQAFAATATEAIAAGDAAGADAALDALRDAQRLVRDTARITAAVESLNADLAEAATADPVVLEYKGIETAVAQVFANLANEALDAGDIAGAKAALSDLSGATRLAKELGDVDTAIADLQSRLDAAVEAGETTVGGVSIDAATAVINAATELRAVGDLASANAAEAAIKAVTPSERGGRGFRSFFRSLRGHRGRH